MGLLNEYHLRGFVKVCVLYRESIEAKPDLLEEGHLSELVCCSLLSGGGLVSRREPCLFHQDHRPLL